MIPVPLAHVFWQPIAKENIGLPKTAVSDGAHVRSAADVSSSGAWFDDVQNRRLALLHELGFLRFVSYYDFISPLFHRAFHDVLLLCDSRVYGIDWAESCRIRL